MGDPLTDMTSLPDDLRRRVEELLAQHPPHTVSAVEFRGAQFDLGLAWVHLPEGCGGLGLSYDDQVSVQALLAAAGARSHATKSLIGLGMGAPTIAAHAQPALRDRLLRPLFTGEEVWCQLFSEPGAGSDLAGVSTSAVRVDGGWVVNGQKVWTSYAHVADWGMLLTRTDPDVPKHKGLTYFALDMRSPGVEVRPLFQITGEAEFNEVWLTDVFVPDEHLLGAEGAGWSVAMTTLMNERTTLASTGDRYDPMAEALALWHKQGGSDPVMRDRLVRLWMRSELAGLTVRRAAESAEQGTPGPEGSIGKLLWAEVVKSATELSLELLGEDALAYPLGYPLERAGGDQQGMSDPRWQYLRSRANSIEGGTSEVLRNVIGERVLGLPGEPRVDKDVPWKETRRG